MRVLALALIGAGLAGSAAQAAGDALVIGNSRYSAVQTLFGAERVTSAAKALYDKGFDVALVQDAGTDEMRRAFGEFTELMDDDGGPVVIVLSGAFVHGVAGSYLLPVTGSGVIREADVLMNGFPLDAALTVLSAHQGRAFLVLGETAAEPELGSYLSPGIGALEIPQGVTVIRGPAVDIARYAARDMARTGRFVLRAAIEYELSIEGYAPATQVIVQEEDVAPPRGAVEPPLQDPSTTRLADEAAWKLAQQADTSEGYRTYMDGFPDGAFVMAARQRLNAIDGEPFYAERKVEEALDLDRDDRRAIQRALTILGYDTRGIDGILGDGSRGAIRRWQRDTDQRVTSYLTKSQIAILQDSAQKRARQLEAEALKQQKALEREERDLWSQVKDRGDEAGFRLYLQRYPQGRFADEARRVLKSIDDSRQQQAVGQDRRDWSQAAQTNTIAAYGDYLEKWPSGGFRAEAEQRIALLRRDAEKVRNAIAGRDEEQRMNLNFVARQLAERRLEQLKLNPGKVDGRFDENTREAIRQYQQSRGIRVSGFLDEQTVIRLLADSLRFE